MSLQTVLRIIKNCSICHNCLLFIIIDLYMFLFWLQVGLLKHSTMLTLQRASWCSLSSVQLSNSSTEKPLIMEALVNIYYTLGRALTVMKKYPLPIETVMNTCMSSYIDAFFDKLLSSLLYPPCEFPSKIWMGGRECFCQNIKIADKLPY